MEVTHYALYTNTLHIQVFSIWNDETTESSKGIEALKRESFLYAKGGVFLMLDIRKVKEHYEIYIKGKFVCSCDLNELNETLAELDL